MSIILEKVEGVYAVCKLLPTEAVPQWAMQGKWWTVSKTADELSVVCLQDTVPIGVPAERDWSMLKVSGQLDFALVGILSAITAPLAETGISVFAISTFDTDYILVKQNTLDTAILALKKSGIIVS